MVIATRTIKSTNPKTHKVKVIIQKGNTYTASQMKKIPQKYHCYLENYTASGVSLNDDQFKFIIEAYVAGGSRTSIAADFRAAYPGCEVPSSSLNRYAAMLEVIDPSHPNSDSMVCNQKLVALAEALYPEAFAA